MPQCNVVPATRPLYLPRVITLWALDRAMLAAKAQMDLVCCHAQTSDCIKYPRFG